jgi:hypothetical protein
MVHLTMLQDRAICKRRKVNQFNREVTHLNDLSTRRP